MGLTMAQKHLIAGLRLFGVERDAIVGIVSMLETPEQQDEMMEWMSTNVGADTAQILRKAAELVR